MHLTIKTPLLQMTALAILAVFATPASAGIRSAGNAAALPSGAHSDAGAPAMRPDKSKVTSYDITFESASGSPYCNGLDVEVIGSVYVTGSSTGCYAGGNDAGFQGKVKGSKDTYLFVTTSDAGSAAVAETWVVDVTNGTWAVYANSGSGQYEINAGEWVYGSPSAIRSSRGRPAANRPIFPLEPQRRAPDRRVLYYDITLETASGSPYCDGLDLGITANVYVTGYSTGCRAFDADEGFQVELKGDHDQNLIVSTTDFDDASYAAVYLVDATNGTWQLWVNEGSSMFEDNAGLWAIGSPSAIPKAPSAIAHDAR